MNADRDVVKLMDLRGALTIPFARFGWRDRARIAWSALRGGTLTIPRETVSVMATATDWREASNTAAESAAREG